jgi:hypothetical protein
LNDNVKLANLFLSQKDTVFIKSNALRGLANYRALQSRLNSSITAVEAFEVYKIGFKDDFKLLDSTQGGISCYPRNIVINDKDLIKYPSN